MGLLRRPAGVFMRLSPRNCMILAGSLGLIVMLGGCAVFHKKKPQKPAASEESKPHPIGTVTLVNEDLKFVLIDVGPSYLPQRGQAVKTFTNGQESGILAITGERQPPFIAADIVKGSPQKGDDVLQ
ncbi:MAG: hypothetical protein QM796_12930 [Chthoniobacteraceae bacterium]